MSNHLLTTQRLAELVSQKRQVLAQLRQVAVRQGELVDAGDAATLLKLLAAKQNLLGGLQKVERALAPFHGQDPETRDWPDATARAACAADAAECALLLEQVMGLEREHERRMTARRDQVAQQLRVAHAAHQAAGAYGQQATRRPTAPSAVALEPHPTTSGLDLTSGT